MNEEPSFAALRHAAPPPIERVRARVRRRARARRVAAVSATLAAAAVALIALWPAQEVRYRGIETSALVSIEAVAEGPAGQLRPLASGGAVAPEERVLFLLRSSADGEARLVERSGSGEAVVWPAGGAWRVDAGEEHTPGGSRPMSWRPDRGAGLYRYEASVCPEGRDTRCGLAHIDLVWEP